MLRKILRKKCPFEEKFKQILMVYIVNHIILLLESLLSWRYGVRVSLIPTFADMEEEG